MRKILTSLTSVLLVPFIPLIVVIILKLIYIERFSWDIIDVSDLTISIAIYLFICLIGVIQLNDKELKSWLIPLYILFIFIFIMLFFVTKVLELQKINELNTYLGNAVQRTDGFKFSCESLSYRVKIPSLVASVSLITLSERFRKKHNIEVTSIC